jgi:hypothetical protein
MEKIYQDNERCFSKNVLNELGLAINAGPFLFCYNLKAKQKLLTKIFLARNLRFKFSQERYFGMFFDDSDS